jgi:hypothetical protein
MDEITAASASSPDDSPSPLSLPALKKLFFSPTAYFQSAPLAKGHAWLFAAWVSGISSGIDRVDQRMMRSEVANGPSGSDMAFILDSWFGFWSFVLPLGGLWALWSWWIGGWWYGVRLRWSGAADPDPRQARLVYTFAGFVFCMPAIVYTIVETAAYPSYRAAWSSDSMWSLAILVFLFWSVVVSWRGVIATFPVRRWRAACWFLVLPVCFYILLFGALGALLASADAGID